VAATPIRRGAKVGDLDVKSVDWPAELIPEGVVTTKEEVVGRSALTGITTNEPLMKAKLSESVGSGFASNTIPPGMRACSIQTNGPSASVAGFVRPGDKVDVLLNLRGNTRDETGGGSTLTLLQSAEILAIDDIMDVDAATVKMWMKEGVKSVTLLVTPEQASLVSLGQSVGTVSLALRNGNDQTVNSETQPVTINQIRNLPAADTFPLQTLLSQLQKSGIAIPGASSAADEPNATENGNGQGVGQNEQASPTPSDVATVPTVDTTSARSTGNGREQDEDAKLDDQENKAGPKRPSYIYTLRGNQSGMVRVLELQETNR
jgi:Flp pilus assembly protein CpaB